MRIPQGHSRRWAAQRQGIACHFVMSFGVGGGQHRVGGHKNVLDQCRYSNRIGYRVGIAHLYHADLQVGGATLARQIEHQNLGGLFGLKPDIGFIYQADTITGRQDFSIHQDLA